jgi:hypothetical protein
MEGNWSEVPFFQNHNGTVGLVVEAPLYCGKDYWVQFKVVHQNGTRIFSKPINMWIDSFGPFVRRTSIPYGYFLPSPVQNFSFQLEDQETGINTSTVEYTVSLDGDEIWSEWRNCYTVGNLTHVNAYVNETFRRGKVNFIRIRSTDNYGNHVEGIKKYEVWINTIPEIIVSSPESGDRLIEDNIITFDASESFDPDGDRLSISWFKSTPTGLDSLGDSYQVLAILEPGEYTITVIAKDSVDNQVQKTFTIMVEPKPVEYIPPDPDIDGDRMPNWWEWRHGLDQYRNDSMNDPDGDGYVNIIEYGGLSDPYDPESYPEYPYVPKERAEEKNVVSIPISMSLIILGCVLTFTAMILVRELRPKKRAAYIEE